MIKTQHPFLSRNAYVTPHVRVISVSTSCVFQVSGATKANPDMDEESFDFDWQ